MDTLIQEHYEKIYKEYLSSLPICPSCLDSSRRLICLDNCKHSFCENCIREFLESRIHEGYRRLQDFKCLDDTCNQKISETQLEQLMEFEYFNKLTNKVVFKLHFLCPSCRNRGEFSSDGDMTCRNCTTSFCRFCKAVEHQGHCNTSTLYFKEVHGAIFDNEIGYCPSCKSPFLKDQNCDHVTCQNPECALEFCFYCSVPFYSIDWHGCMYHRKDCRNYEDQDCENEFCQDCPECQKEMLKNGHKDTVCQRPQQTRKEIYKQIMEFALK